jgi:hypothetical protein
VFHRRVIEVDLKPVPDDDRTPRQGENVLHDASSGIRRDRLGRSLSAGPASCTTSSLSTSYKPAQAR